MTVTRVTPRAVSSSARFAPTMPAPMITTRGEVDIPCSWCPLGGLLRGGSGRDQPAVRYSVAASSSQRGQVSGERRAHHDLVAGARVVEGHQHDAGLAEQRLGCGAAAEHPRVQVERAAAGEQVAHVLAAQQQGGALCGDVDHEPHSRRGHRRRPAVRISSSSGVRNGLVINHSSGPEPDRRDGLALHVGRRCGGQGDAEVPSDGGSRRAPPGRPGGRPSRRTAAG